MGLESIKGKVSKKWVEVSGCSIADMGCSMADMACGVANMEHGAATLTLSQKWSLSTSIFLVFVL